VAVIKESRQRRLLTVFRHKHNINTRLSTQQPSNQNDPQGGIRDEEFQYLRSMDRRYLHIPLLRSRHLQSLPRLDTDPLWSRLHRKLIAHHLHRDPSAPPNLPYL